MTQKILVLAIAMMTVPAASKGYDGRPYYPYRGPYRYYDFGVRADTQLELSRLRRELRNRRAFEAEQRRHQQQERNPGCNEPPPGSIQNGEYDD